jgi:hypothetical protein
VLRTYRAILKGNRLEWSEDAPAPADQQSAVAVHVTFLEEPEETRGGVEQGQHMAAALEQLAAIHAVNEMEDPARWEREIRQDRPLPDREM